MHNDDIQIGRLLTRREVFQLIGATSGGALIVSGLPASAWQSVVPGCVVRPAQTEGPYFVEERLLRSDIRTDPTNGKVSPGAQLDLTFTVTRVASGGCAPLAGAQIDIWQCDAAGIYSDVADPSFNTKGQKFLRGHQMTDGSGVARFTTIYPGWYQGRTVHIHFKIRTTPAAARGYEFVSQVYFDDAFTDKVFGKPPYAAKSANRTRNEQDGIFRENGKQLIVNVTETARGYAAPFAIGLQI